ncbi:MAG: EAL domain-containing response regulator [Pseudohongiella sp.]|nr:EAL domain-containing response regulator [Pseudohongiella sp.]MDO9522063.1 EAL domain-containing response regulator [Pseudohongiella sp.]
MKTFKSASHKRGNNESDAKPIMLIIDDDAFFRAQIRHFSEADYQVLEYESPVSIEPKSLLEADIAILDLNMPGIDGVEFLKTLAALTTRPKLVIASGYDSRVIGMAQKTAELYGINGTAVLQKPVTRNQFSKALLDLEVHVSLNTNGVLLAPSVRSRDENEISSGLRAGEFFPYYQPQIEVLTQKVVGIETLARWRHPEFGILSPASFIETLEISPLATKFTLLITETAMRDYSLLSGLTGYSGKLSINIPVEVVSSETFSNKILNLANKYQFPLHKLVLEITERGLESTGALFISTLTRLKMHGIQLSLDDFGTGQSGFSKLKTRAFDEIKIDKSFIEDVLTSRDSQMIVESILRLSTEANLCVVAEGVEDIETLDWLRECGCPVVQGYYFSRPLALDNLTEWMKNWGCESMPARKTD